MAGKKYGPTRTTSNEWNITNNSFAFFAWDEWEKNNKTVQPTNNVYIYK